MKRYRATWIDYPPAGAEVDDGPNLRTAEYSYRHTALFAAPYYAAKGPSPDRWQVQAWKLRPARSLLRRVEWVPDGPPMVGPEGSPYAGQEGGNG